MTINSQPVSATDITKVAWRVNIQDMSCVVFATTAPKARWIAVRSYWEAGYGRGKGDWPRAKAERVPMLDTSKLRNEPPKAFFEDYVWDTV